MKKAVLALFLAVITMSWVAPAMAAAIHGKSYKVSATAYNSVRAQTNSNPTIAAWGDRLKPGMKAIAVSRDLLNRGFKRGTIVKISGLPGEYVVLDKMNKRWRNKIDIYMGQDVQAARNWGRRNVTITVVRS